MTSLVFDRQYYRQVYHQGFDQIAQMMKEDCDKYNGNIAFVSYADRSFMNEFYEKRAIVRNADYFCCENKIVDFQNYLNGLKTDYLGIGLADHAEMSWELSAVAEFPYFVNEKTWFTTRYLTLSKNDNGNTLLKTVTLKNGNKAENIHVDRNVTWACTCAMSFDSISSDAERIGYIAEIQAVDTIRNLSFVVRIDDAKNDSTLVFRDYAIKDFVIVPNQKCVMPCGAFIPKTNRNDLKISVFIWNRANVEFDVRKISFYEIKKNKYFYGLYNPL